MSTVAMPRKREAESRPPAKGSAGDKANVGDTERWLSVAGGGLLALYGLQKGDLPGIGLAALGGTLLHRGLTGHCALYSALDVSTENHGQVAAVAAGRGMKVVQAMTIDRPVEDLYRYWSNFDNLPRFMNHLVSVKSTGTKSHWIAKAPAGATVSWDAEIVNQDPNRLIAWRSLEGSQVATAGAVHFIPQSHERGAVVHVELKYDPPGGKLGSWVAWAFGQDPKSQVREDLRRFKQLMEAGEIPTTTGQPSGRR